MQDSFHSITRNGTADDVYFLYGKGRNINEWNQSGQTPLGAAAGDGNTAVVRALVEIGADPDSDDYDNSPAIEYSIWAEHHETTLALLEYGDDAARKSRAEFAICTAASHGDAVFVATMLDRGLDVNMGVETGEGALLAETARGAPGRRRSERVAVARLLLERGATVDTTGAKHTAVYWAAERGFSEMVRLLRDAGAYVGLINAAQVGDLEMVNDCLRAGTNVNARDSCGRTALFCAASRGPIEIARRLLDAGADPFLANNEGDTPLYEAVFEGHIEKAALLAQHGIAKDPEELIYVALEQGDNAIAALLLTYPCDVNKRLNQRNGDTLLMMAAGQNEEEIVRLLVDAGANIEAVNDFGYTALMYATDQGFKESALALLYAGADLRPRNIHGASALDCALDNGGEEMADLLRQWKRAQANSGSDT